MDAARLFPVLIALLLSLCVGVSEGIDSDWSRGWLGLLLPDEASELVRLERRIPLLLLCRYEAGRYSSSLAPRFPRFCTFALDIMLRVEFSRYLWGH